MEMDNFDEIRDNILQGNRPFISRAEIKYVGWLTGNATSKSASSVIIEFIKPEDASKIIGEGLVWQGELFQCERFDRQCRLKQSFKCQKYGNIGTQCTYTTIRSNKRKFNVQSPPSLRSSSEQCVLPLISVCSCLAVGGRS